MQSRLHPLFGVLSAGLALALVAGAACSDPPSQADAGPPAETTLQILDPPGADIGLAPGAETLLRVRLSSQAGIAIPGATMQFAIFGDPRGSTLSADSSYTSSDGVAQVQLRAGGASCSFQVHVSAPGAAEVIFYVEVSSAGFGAVGLRSVYDGQAGTSESWQVHYLLYEDLRCSALVPPDLPPALRERLASSLEETVNLRALPLDVSHAVLALAHDDRQLLQAAGCVELPPHVLRPTQELQLTLALSDVQPVLSGSFLLRSVLRQTLPSGPRPAADLLTAWEDLVDCPLDPAQLLLDCILDAVDPGDSLDCLVESPGATTKAIQSERGLLGDGCRSEQTSRATPSLEWRLNELMRAADQGLLPELQEIPTQARALLEQLHLESRLQVAAASQASGRVSLWHRLLSLGFGSGQTPELSYSLAQLGLPQPEAGPLQGTVSGWQLQIAEHSLSLGLGLAGRLALNEQILSALDLRDAEQLAEVLVALVRQPGSPAALIGCPALEVLICQAARLPSNCLGAACPAGVEALGRYLDGPFAERSGAWTTISWAASAILVDQDRDLHPEQLGTAEAPGQWHRVRINAGETVLKPQEATFIGNRE